jgi:hypothetical protein
LLAAGDGDGGAERGDDAPPLPITAVGEVRGVLVEQLDDELPIAIAGTSEENPIASLRGLDIRGRRSGA